MSDIDWANLSKMSAAPAAQSAGPDIDWANLSKMAPVGSAPPAPPAAPARKLGTAGNVGMGALSGAAKIGSTVLDALDPNNLPFIGPVAGPLIHAAADKIGGMLGMAPQATGDARRQALGQFFGQNADPNSIPFKAGEIGSSIAGTAGVGPVLGMAARGAGAAPTVINALESGGLKLGAPAAATIGGRLGQLALRSAGGAANGAVSAGMVDPTQTLGGAAVGAALPAAVRAAAFGGSAVGAGARIAKNAVLPNTDLAASQILRKYATNPAAAVASPATPGVQFTLGQATSDPGLLALENAQRMKNPGAFVPMQQSNNAALSGAVDSLAPPMQAADDAVKQALTSGIQASKATATKNFDAVRQMAAGVGPITPTNTQQAVRSLLSEYPDLFNRPGLQDAGLQSKLQAISGALKPAEYADEGGQISTFSRPADGAFDAAGQPINAAGSAPRIPNAGAPSSDFLSSLKAAGGLKPELATEILGARKDGIRQLPGLFRNGGMNSDALVEWAHNNGFLVGSEDSMAREADAHDLIRQVAEGNSPLKVAQQGDAYAAQAAQRGYQDLADRAQQLGVDMRGKTWNQIDRDVQTAQAGAGAPPMQSTEYAQPGGQITEYAPQASWEDLSWLRDRLGNFLGRARAQAGATGSAETRALGQVLAGVHADQAALAEQSGNPALKQALDAAKAQYGQQVVPFKQGILKSAVSDPMVNAGAAVVRPGSANQAQIAQAVLQAQPSAEAAMRNAYLARLADAARTGTSDMGGNRVLSPAQLQNFLDSAQPLHSMLATPEQQKAVSGLLSDMRALQAQQGIRVKGGSDTAGQQAGLSDLAAEAAKNMLAHKVLTHLPLISDITEHWYAANQARVLGKVQNGLMNPEVGMQMLQRAAPRQSALPGVPPQYLGLLTSGVSAGRASR